jgi:hypothetical protein
MAASFTVFLFDGVMKALYRAWPWDNFRNRRRKPRLFRCRRMNCPIVMAVARTFIVKVAGL